LLLSSNFLTGQSCNARINIDANYNIEEVVQGDFEILGGFTDFPYNSLNYTFTISVINAPSSIQTFKIDFGNGQTRTLNLTPSTPFPLTQTFDIDYTTVGTKTITTTITSIDLTVVSGSQTLSVSKSRTLENLNYISPTKTQIITGASFLPVCQGFLPVLKDRQAGAASIYMHTLLNPNNTTGHLVKPLIFVEGIDFDTKTAVCDPNNIGGSVQNVHIGDFGWDNFVTGVFQDPLSSSNQTFALLPNLISQMRNEGYDIVFCDFEDGADWIQKNSLALIAVIEEVNRDKRLNNSGVCFPNMVIGASMGGQVAKWALRTMEVQDKDHDSALYVSFDSPQRGANIPISVQSFLWFNSSFGDAPSRAAVEPRWNAINRPAAQQLLVHHFNKIEQTNGCDLRQLFAAEMVSLGYPTKTRNIATSNGSGIGVGQGYGNSTLLADIQGRTRFVGIPIEVLCAKLSASGASTITDMCKITYEDYTISPLPPSYTKDVTSVKMVVSRQGGQQIQVQITKKEQGFSTFFLHNYLNTSSLGSHTLTFNHDIRDWDNAPGGNRGDIVRSIIPGILSGLNKYEISAPMPIPNDINRQTFIPSISALDIQTGIDNVGLNIDAIIGDELFPNPSATPFSAVFFASANESHVQVTDPLGNFILAQMQLAQVTLQSPLSEPYNYGLIRTIIPSVTVVSGGILGVNNNGRTAYVNRTTSEAPTQKPVFEAVAVSSCDANIIVQNGGQIQLGAGWSNSGVLRIAKGTVVTLQAGSTLQLNNASQLTIDSAGRLIIDKDAIINFGSLTSRILVKKGGELIINGSPVITGSGHFYFEKDNVYTQNDNVVLEGTGKDIPLFKIGSGASVSHSTNFELKFEKCAVIKEGTADQPYLQCRNSASISAENVLFKAIRGNFNTSSNNFIHTYNVDDATLSYTDTDFEFRNCTFKDANTVFRLEDTRDKSLGTYFVNRDFGPISVEFWSCNFENTGTAIIADRSRRIEFAHCNLNGCGIVAETTWFLFVRNTKIRGIASAIKTHDVGYFGLLTVPLLMAMNWGELV
jgi:hypothetical protein